MQNLTKILMKEIKELDENKKSFKEHLTFNKEFHESCFRAWKNQKITTKDYFMINRLSSNLLNRRYKKLGWSF